MGNLIRFDKNSPVEDWLRMSNGATDVFINVLSLSGSELAHTIDEKRLIVWLSEKDQKIGMGIVGFDVVDMPWNASTFDENKSFILKVIDAAHNKTGWEKLGYCPNEDLLFPRLQKFSEYIRRLSLNDIQQNALDKWLSCADKSNPINCGFPRCPIHNTLLTYLGCQVCN